MYVYTVCEKYSSKSNQSFVNFYNYYMVRIPCKVNARKRSQKDRTDSLSLNNAAHSEFFSFSSLIAVDESL